MAVTIKWKTGREPHANEQLLAAHLQPYREVPSAASVRAVWLRPQSRSLRALLRPNPV
jgi:hypothetical protein